MYWVLHERRGVETPPDMSQTKRMKIHDRRSVILALREKTMPKKRSQAIKVKVRTLEIKDNTGARERNKDNIIFGGYFEDV